jgi:hypothetical protein
MPLWGSFSPTARSLPCRALGRFPTQVGGEEIRGFREGEIEVLSVCTSMSRSRPLRPRTRPPQAPVLRDEVGPRQARGNSKYFLLPDGWTLENGVIFVMPDGSEEVRYEFVH